MKSNEQTELTSKIETDPWMASRLTAVGAGGGEGVEELGKRDSRTRTTVW